MASNIPTPVSFFKAVWLCLLLVFCPKKFILEERKDIESRNNYIGKQSDVPRAKIVRAALFKSLGLVILSGLFGYAFAKVSNLIGFCSSPYTVTLLQVCGASILLWGTLFVRGWEIQSYAGVLFSERVNQWLYRFLYCLGTSIIVFSLFQTACI